MPSWFANAKQARSPSDNPLFRVLARIMATAYAASRSNGFISKPSTEIDLRIWASPMSRSDSRVPTSAMLTADAIPSVRYSPTIAAPGSCRRKAIMADASSTTLFTPILARRLAPPFREEFVDQAYALGRVLRNKLLDLLYGGSAAHDVKFIVHKMKDHIIGFLDTHGLAKSSRNDYSPSRSDCNTRVIWSRWRGVLGRWGRRINHVPNVLVTNFQELGDFAATVIGCRKCANPS